MATGLQFFNYDRLGYIPLDCWEECELEPKGKESPSAKGKNRTRRSPSGYLEDRRALTPEELLIAEEENTDMIEVGEKISFVDPWETGIFRPLKTKLEFSLAAAANLARILGYTKEELLDGENARVIGFYLARDGEGDIAGMDGVIGFYLSESRNADVCSAVKTFATRMIPHRPEVSEGFRLELVAAAKNGVGSAMALGIIVFGSIFKRWVEETN